MVFQRGQLLFEEVPGPAFAEARENGDVIEVDPFGDLNVQLTAAKKEA